MSFAGLNIGGLTLGVNKNSESAGNNGEEIQTGKDYGSARIQAEEVRHWMESQDSSQLDNKCLIRQLISMPG